MLHKASRRKHFPFVLSYHSLLKPLQPACLPSIAQEVPGTCPRLAQLSAHPTRLPWCGWQEAVKTKEKEHFLGAVLLQHSGVTCCHASLGCCRKTQSSSYGMPWEVGVQGRTLKARWVPRMNQMGS